MLTGTSALCSPSKLTFSTAKASAIYRHIKHMLKIWSLRVFLCFWVQAHALAVFQLCSITHLRHTGSTSPTSDGNEAWPQWLEAVWSMSRPCFGWQRIRDPQSILKFCLETHHSFEQGGKNLICTAISRWWFVTPFLSIRLVLCLIKERQELDL